MTQSEPVVVALTMHEWERLNQIVVAAREKDWSRFCALSDTPFNNVESMREQFEGSASKLASAENYQIIAHAVLMGDGTRLIDAGVQTQIGDRMPIVITLESKSDKADSVIGIWTFYVRPEWLNFDH